MNDPRSTSMRIEGEHLRPRPRRVQDRPVPGEPLWVEKPEVSEVLDVAQHRILPASAVLGHDYEALMKTRAAIMERLVSDSTPLYRCPMCLAPVHICRSVDRPKFFFRHRSQDGNCPAQARGLSHSEIDARRYNGAKESKLHRQMKDWICQCLAADDRFSHIEQEAVWTGQLTAEWRKPDVRAVYQGQPIAFEIQLSTTYLDVIVGRRSFYQREGALLVWIFAQFDAEHRRMTEDDVFYGNNLNAFVVNKHTVMASREAARFQMDCCWVVPLKDGGQSGLQWRTVCFDELTLNRATQQVYYFDYDGAKRQLLTQGEAAGRELRQDFEAWLIAKGNYSSTAEAHWQAFRVRFRNCGVSLPAYFHATLRNACRALLSVKKGRPVGLDRKQLVEVAHHVASYEPENLLWFMRAVQHYALDQTLASQGTRGAWARKLAKAREAYKADPGRFRPCAEARPLAEFLFPELAPLP